MTHVRITRCPVESSCITAIGYAETASILEVQFRSGAVYRYAPVPLEVHAALMNAISKGAHLNRFIKGRYHEHREPPEPPRNEAGRRPRNS